MADHYTDRYHGFRPRGWPFRMFRYRFLEALSPWLVGVLVGFVLGVWAAHRVEPDYLRSVELPAITVEP